MILNSFNVPPFIVSMSLIPSGELKVQPLGLTGAGVKYQVSMSLIPSGELKGIFRSIFHTGGLSINESNSLRGVERLAFSLAFSCPIT